MSKPTALFIGRFQPFHMGHLLVIQGMTKLAGKIIIGIGSSDKSGTPDDPFTSKERIEMIQRSLQTVDIIPMYDVNFVELPDMHDDKQWANHVLELTGPVDKLWSGNVETDQCFVNKIEVQTIKEVPGISASVIRDMMRKGQDWEEKVPEEAVRYIKEIEGEKRVRR